MTAVLPGGTGGSTPAPSTWERAIYDTDTASASVAANVSTPLSFGALSSGNTMLDLSTPTRPTLLADGVYAVTAVVNETTAPNISHAVWVELELDADGEDADFINTDFAATPNGSYCSITGTYFIPSGGAISITARHFDNVSHAFGVNVTIQRVA